MAAVGGPWSISEASPQAVGALTRRCRRAKVAALAGSFESSSRPYPAAVACEDVHTTELFGRFSAHYGFSCSFCNPASGHEKGNVENKVDFIRRNLFVPLPQITNIDIFNKRLLDKCMALSKKCHWIKNESEEQLLIEDRFALLGLPGKAFSVVSYMKAKANKKARFG